MLVYFFVRFEESCDHGDRRRKLLNVLLEDLKDPIEFVQVARIRKTDVLVNVRVDDLVDKTVGKVSSHNLSELDPQSLPRNF